MMNAFAMGIMLYVTIGVICTSGAMALIWQYRYYILEGLSAKNAPKIMNILIWPAMAIIYTAIWPVVLFVAVRSIVRTMRSIKRLKKSL